MSFFRRKVHFKYCGKNSLILTTPFSQKSFDIFEGCVIDLLNLKKVSDTFGSYFTVFDSPSDFFVKFTRNQELDCLDAHVYARVSEDNVKLIETTNFSKGEKIFSLNLWVE